MRWLLPLLVLSACPAVVQPGDACRQEKDCDGLPRAWCSRAEVCTRACDDETPCPSGSTCVTAGARRVCLHACTAESDCRPGFVCGQTAEGPVCLLLEPLEVPRE